MRCNVWHKQWESHQEFDNQFCWRVSIKHVRWHSMLLCMMSSEFTYRTGATPLCSHETELRTKCILDRHFICLVSLCKNVMVIWIIHQFFVWNIHMFLRTSWLIYCIFSLIPSKINDRSGLSSFQSKQIRRNVSF